MSRLHIWSANEDSGPKGADKLREFYSGLIESGSNRFEYAVERIIIGDDTLVTEGAIHAFLGRTIDRDGLEGFDKDKCYATRGRTVTFCHLTSTGKIIGEDIYSLTTDITDAEEVILNEYTYGSDESSRVYWSRRSTEYGDVRTCNATP